MDARAIFISKMTFQLCCCCSAHGPELLFFMSFFDLTGEVSWSEMEKVMMSPCAWSNTVQVPEMGDMAPASSTTLPQGLVSSCYRRWSSSQYFPTGSCWFLVLAVIWACCCRQPGCCPHAPRERSVHFYASPLFLSHPNLRYSPQFRWFWSVRLNL